MISPYLVYLLHVDLADAPCRHYVGSTRSEHFAGRMRAHANGYGTVTTAQYYREGARLAVAALWPTSDRALERALLEQENLEPWCVLCTPPVVRRPTSVHIPFWLDRLPPQVDASLSFRVRPA